ncbi:MAG: hypothetical protein WEB00_09495 [Dehalococcoidia bacterium]
MPLFSVGLGAVMAAAFWIGGSLESGLEALAVMAAVGAVFFFGWRNETIAGLGGPGRDERWAMIDSRASGLAGLFLLALIAGLWLVEIAQGEDASPYTQLLAVSGVAYLVAMLYLKWRS